MSSIQTVRIFKNSCADPTNSSFGKSKGTSSTTRIEFNAPGLNNQLHRIAASLTAPSCCSTRYLEISVVDEKTSRIISVWLNKNSFKKRCSTVAGFPLLQRYFPEAAKTVPHPHLRVYERSAPRSSLPAPRPPQGTFAPQSHDIALSPSRYALGPVDPLSIASGSVPLPTPTSSMPVSRPPLGLGVPVSTLDPSLLRDSIGRVLPQSVPSSATLPPRPPLGIFSPGPEALSMRSGDSMSTVGGMHHLVPRLDVVASQSAPRSSLPVPRHPQGAFAPQSHDVALFSSRFALGPVVPLSIASGSVLVTRDLLTRGAPAFTSGPSSAPREVLGTSVPLYASTSSMPVSTHPLGTFSPGPEAFSHGPREPISTMGRMPLAFYQPMPVSRSTLGPTGSDQLHSLKSTQAPIPPGLPLHVDLRSMPGSMVRGPELGTSLLVSPYVGDRTGPVLSAELDKSLATPGLPGAVELPPVRKRRVVPSIIDRRLTHFGLTSDERSRLYLAFRTVHSVEAVSFIDRKISGLARDVLVHTNSGDKRGYALFVATDKGDRPFAHGGYKTFYSVVGLHDGKYYVVGLSNLISKKRLEFCTREAHFGERVSTIDGIGLLLVAMRVDNLFYFIMPYLSGGTLADRFSSLQQNSSAFSPKQRLLWLQQVFETVLTMHSRGILHRDLKPENILFENNRPLVCDLGFATEESDTSELGIHNMCGTPSYMAPELWHSKVKATRRTDMWALGVLLYEFTFLKSLPWSEEEMRHKNQLSMREAVKMNIPHAPSWMPPFPHSPVFGPRDTEQEGAIRHLICNMLQVDPNRRIVNPLPALASIINRLDTLPVPALTSTKV